MRIFERPHSNRVSNGISNIPEGEDAAREPLKRTDFPRPIHTYYSDEPYENNSSYMTLRDRSSCNKPTCFRPYRAGIDHHAMMPHNGELLMNSTTLFTSRGQNRKPFARAYRGSSRGRGNSVRWQDGSRGQNRMCYRGQQDMGLKFYRGRGRPSRRGRPPGRRRPHKWHHDLNSNLEESYSKISSNHQPRGQPRGRLIDLEPHVNLRRLEDCNIMPSGNGSYRIPNTSEDTTRGVSQSSNCNDLLPIIKTTKEEVDNETQKECNSSNLCSFVVEPPPFANSIPSLVLKVEKKEECDEQLSPPNEDCVFEPMKMLKFSPCHEDSYELVTALTSQCESVDSTIPVIESVKQDEYFSMPKLSSPIEETREVFAAMADSLKQSANLQMPKLSSYLDEPSEPVSDFSIHESEEPSPALVTGAMVSERSDHSTPITEVLGSETNEVVDNNKRTSQDMVGLTDAWTDDEDYNDDDDDVLKIDEDRLICDDSQQPINEEDDLHLQAKEEENGLGCKEKPNSEQNEHSDQSNESLFNKVKVTNIQSIEDQIFIKAPLVNEESSQVEEKSPLKHSTSFQQVQQCRQDFDNIGQHNIDDQLHLLNGHSDHEPLFNDLKITNIESLGEQKIFIEKPSKCEQSSQAQRCFDKCISFVNKSHSQLIQEVDTEQVINKESSLSELLSVQNLDNSSQSNMNELLNLLEICPISNVEQNGEKEQLNKEKPQPIQQPICVANKDNHYEDKDISRASSTSDKYKQDKLVVHNIIEPSSDVSTSVTSEEVITNIENSWIMIEPHQRVNENPTLTDDKLTEGDNSRKKRGRRRKHEKVNQSSMEGSSHHGSSVLQSKGARFAQEIPRFNWLEQKILSGDVNTKCPQKQIHATNASSSSEESGSPFKQPKVVELSAKENVNIKDGKDSIITVGSDSMDIPKVSETTRKPTPDIERTRVPVIVLTSTQNNTLEKINPVLEQLTSGGELEVTLSGPSVASNTNTSTAVPPASFMSVQPLPSQRNQPEHVRPMYLDSLPLAAAAWPHIHQRHGGQESVPHPNDPWRWSAQWPSVAAEPAKDRAPPPSYEQAFSERVATMARHASTSFDTGLGLGLGNPPSTPQHPPHRLMKRLHRKHSIPPHQVRQHQPPPPPTMMQQHMAVPQPFTQGFMQYPSYYASAYRPRLLIPTAQYPKTSAPMFEGISAHTHSPTYHMDHRTQISHAPLPFGEEQSLIGMSRCSQSDVSHAVSRNVDRPQNHCPASLSVVSTEVRNHTTEEELEKLELDKQTTKKMFASCLNNLEAAKEEVKRILPSDTKEDCQLRTVTSASSTREMTSDLLVGCHQKIPSVDWTQSSGNKLPLPLRLPVSISRRQSIGHSGSTMSIHSTSASSASSRDDERSMNQISRPPEPIPAHLSSIPTISVSASTSFTSRHTLEESPIDLSVFKYESITPEAQPSSAVKHTPSTTSFSFQQKHITSEQEEKLKLIQTNVSIEPSRLRHHLLSNPNMNNAFLTTSIPTMSVANSHSGRLLQTPLPNKIRRLDSSENSQHWNRNETTSNQQQAAVLQRFMSSESAQMMPTSSSYPLIPRLNNPTEGQVYTSNRSSTERVQQMGPYEASAPVTTTNILHQQVSPMAGLIAPDEGNQDHYPRERISNHNSHISNYLCTNCGMDAKFICSLCHSAAYCGPICQTQHWKYHALSCSRSPSDNITNR